MLKFKVVYLYWNDSTKGEHFVKAMGGDSVRASWISWWTANVIWILLFAAGSFVVWTREVDGAGVTQTPELKLIAFIVLLVAFIIPLVFQIVWLIINLKKSKNH